MNCPTDGVLRASIDRELSAAESAAVDQHLTTCATCQTRSKAIHQNMQHVREAFAAAPGDTPLSGAAAYSRYRQNYGARLQGRAALANRMLASWKRPALGWAAAACTLALLLSFAPGRTWAQRILSMLRVQKVAVVPIDLSALNANVGDAGHGKLMAQFISDNVVITMKPGAPTPEPDLQTASNLAGFHATGLDQLGSPKQISVQDEGAFHITLDRDRMQAVLDQAGRSDIQLPASVDGSEIAVHIPKSVRMVYGDCAAAAPAHCINFMQVPSPAVSVPPNLNIGALAEAGLQLGGMSAADAHAFCQTIDWTTTLVIPISQASSSYRTVPVDGVNGTLIETPPSGNFVGRYMLTWIKQGIVYSIAGKGTPDLALSAAASLN